MTTKEEREAQAVQEFLKELQSILNLYITPCSNPEEMVDLKRGRESALKLIKRMKVVYDHVYQAREDIHEQGLMEIGNRY
jgi:hypothetical protein